MCLQKECLKSDQILAQIFKDEVNEDDTAKEKLRPTDEAVDVFTEIWVQGISKISDITSDFILDLYLSEVWNDPSLKFDKLQPCQHNISVHHDVLKKIWAPNSCFINSKTALIHHSPFKNTFLMFYSNGTVWTNYRLQLTGPCDMDLTRFPFDHVLCKLTFESFNYNNEEVRMQWKKYKPILLLNPDYELADYELIHYDTKIEAVKYPAGLWDELTMIFKFKRRHQWYILQAYLPTYVTIFISWMSFALGVNAIPARTMLGVNAIMAMTFQFGSIIQNLPRVSYVKAIDVWMLSCMTFVFVSLLELAAIGWLTRHLLEYRQPTYGRRGGTTVAILQREESIEDIIPLDRAESGIGTPQAALSNGYYNGGYSLKRPPKVARKVRNQPLKACVSLCLCLTRRREYMEMSIDEINKRREMFAHKLDQFCAFMFPTLFSIFNVWYWFTYATKQSDMV